MNYLLDTNVLTDLHDGRLLESLPTGGYACSVISEIEILSWPGIALDEIHTSDVLSPRRCATCSDLASPCNSR